MHPPSCSTGWFYLLPSKALRRFSFNPIRSQSIVLGPIAAGYYRDQNDPGSSCGVAQTPTQAPRAVSPLGHPRRFLEDCVSSLLSLQPAPCVRFAIVSGSCSRPLPENGTLDLSDNCATAAESSTIIRQWILPMRSRSNLPVPASIPKGKGSSRLLFSSENHSSANDLSS